MNVVPKHIYVVGAGGVTSYFLPVFIRTMSQAKPSPRIHVIDGDVLEERNLDRQLFAYKYVGENKAHAVVEMCGERYNNMRAEPKYFTGSYRPVRGSLMFAFVDNHTARKEVLSVCDRYECAAIIGANEYTDAQAMYYHWRWRGSIFDPRVRYPEILSDESDNPLRPRGCTGDEVVQAAPQLPIANFASASHALQLFWYRYQIEPSMKVEDRKYGPVEHSNNLNQMKTRMEKDYAEIDDGMAMR